MALFGMINTDRSRSAGPASSAGTGFSKFEKQGSLSIKRNLQNSNALRPEARREIIDFLHENNKFKHGQVSNVALYKDVKKEFGYKTGQRFQKALTKAPVDLGLSDEQKLANVRAGQASSGMADSREDIRSLSGHLSGVKGSAADLETVHNQPTTPPVSKI